jgi:pSer/pThr/pTyr-binding forkhead associated (FHA) protein
MRAYLVNDAGTAAHTILNRSTTIGRDSSNAIVVADPRASRFHAEIRREAGGFALHSMGSAGTIVNGKLLEAPCLLADGDTIQIAFAVFRFSRSEPAGVNAAALADASAADARRRPTLSTAGIPMSAVEPDRRIARLVLFVFALLVGIAAVLWLALGR